MRRMSVSSNSALTLCRCNWPKAGSFSSIGVSTAGWPPSTPFPRGGRCGGALKTIVPIQKASRGSSSSAINLFELDSEWRDGFGGRGHGLDPRRLASSASRRASDQQRRDQGAIRAAELRSRADKCAKSADFLPRPMINYCRRQRRDFRAVAIGPRLGATANTHQPTRLARRRPAPKPAGLSVLRGAARRADPKASYLLKRLRARRYTKSAVCLIRSK